MAELICTCGLDKNRQYQRIGYGQHLSYCKKWEIMLSSPLCPLCGADIREHSDLIWKMHINEYYSKYGSSYKKNEVEPEISKKNYNYLHQSSDAVVWADAFMEIWGHRLNEIDKELMIGWFANAIMAGYDLSNKKTNEKINELTRKFNDHESRYHCEKCKYNFLSSGHPCSKHFD